MSTPVFDDVTVTVGPSGGKLVDWRLSPFFEPETDDLEFFVEVARSAGEWLRLNPDDPLHDVCAYLDETRYRYNMENDLYYRVVVVDGDNVHYSQPGDTMGALNRHDRLIAQAIIRKEYLRMKEKTGAAGYLLRRRSTGEPCTHCRDWDTEEVVDSQCPYCYGVGIVYGYYNAFYPYYLESISGPRSVKDVRAPHAVEDTKAVQRRAIAYPRISTYDVWIDGTTGKRYVIRAITVGADIRGKPLIYAPVELREIPPTGREYDVPLVQEGPESNPPSPQSGWREGISVLTEQ